MAVTPLTDLATVKAWLKITTSANDALLASLITAVSSAIGNYCNRNFGSASYVETYDGDGSSKLWLNQRPISAIASVTVDGVSIKARTTPGAYGFAFDKNQVGIDGGVFCDGFQNVVVSYTAGYAISAVLTPDLWQAAAEWAGIEYKKSDHVDMDTVGMGIAGSTVYAKDMPWTVRAVVDRYRQVAPVSPLGR